MLWQGGYKGQKQKWMALRFTCYDSDIMIATEEPEFCEWKWLPPHDLVDLAVPFKRDIYQNVLAAFALFKINLGTKKPPPKASVAALLVFDL